MKYYAKVESCAFYGIQYCQYVFELRAEMYIIG